MPTRHFVSIDANGAPMFQRTSNRAEPYRSASYEGASFSKTPPNGAYPRTVLEVPQAIEWVARVALSDGSTVVNRSKRTGPARNFVRYSYASHARRGERLITDTCTRRDREEWLREWSRAHTDLRVVEFIAFESVEIRHWPTPGATAHVVLATEAASTEPLPARAPSYGPDSSFANASNPHGYPDGSPQATGEADYGDHE